MLAMAEARSTPIPAFTLIAGAMIIITSFALTLRLARPIHLDDMDRRDDAARAYADVDTRLDINCATAAELSLLPGVGPRLAQRIVDHRAASGPFRSIDDLHQVSGIGEKTIERLQAYAVAGPQTALAGASIARAADDPGR